MTAEHTQHQAHGDRNAGPGVVSATDRVRPNFVASYFKWLKAEVSENLDTTRSIENLWFASRIAIIVVSVTAAILTWGSAGSSIFIFVAGALALAGNLVLFQMLRHGRVATLAMAGFAIDNVSLLIGWTGSLWVVEESLRTNDMYLAMFPILVLWSSRLGFRLGIPYTIFWMGWISWTYIAFLPPNSYEIEQLPVRIAFLTLTSFLGMWTARLLKSQKRIADESTLRATTLQELDRAKDQFIATVSHELRTPMAAILGFTRLARNDAETELQRDRFNVIERNSERLKLLIDDLLDLSRIQSDKLSISIAPIEVAAFVNRIADDLVSVIVRRSQVLLVNVTHDPCWINGDHTRLAQVMFNLITNASKYSPDGSTVQLNSSVKAGELTLSVVDQGDGIDPDDQGSLFHPFFRTKSAENSTVPGTGLGLFISRRIVLMHDGELNLTSKPGAGTTVEVRLPNVSFERPADRGRKPSFANAFDDLDEVV